MSYIETVILIFVLNFAMGLWAFFPYRNVKGQNRSGNPTFESFTHSQAFFWLLSALCWALVSTLAFVAVLL